MQGKWLAAPPVAVIKHCRCLLQAMRNWAQALVLKMCVWEPNPLPKVFHSLVLTTLDWVPRLHPHREHQRYVLRKKRSAERAERELQHEISIRHAPHVKWSRLQIINDSGLCNLTMISWKKLVWNYRRVDNMICFTMTWSERVNHQSIANQLALVPKLLLGLVAPTVIMQERDAVIMLHRHNRVCLLFELNQTCLGLCSGRQRRQCANSFTNWPGLSLDPWALYSSSRHTIIL